MPRPASASFSLVRRSPGSGAGFTLVELLVVIGIIAVLASIAFPVLSRIQEKGRVARTVSNLRQVGTWVLAYATDNDGRTPVAGGALAYGQTDPVTQKPPWQEQLEQTGRGDRRVFAGTPPEQLPSGEWVSQFFLGSRAAYAESGEYGPILLTRISEPARYLLVGEVRIPGLFPNYDADRDNYTQDPAFDSNGNASPAAHVRPARRLSSIA